MSFDRAIACRLTYRWMVFVLLLSVPASAQPQTRQPFQQQAPSSIAYKLPDTVDIQNAAYELVGPGIPGRPKDERLVVRKTTRTKQRLDEKGIEATTIVEAWPLGIALDERPLYAVNVAGVEPTTLNGALLVIARGLEEVGWWSTYKLGTGQHLFDTHVPAVQFSISRETLTLRYVGLEVPPDDVADRRLRAPNVVAVLIYASGEHVVREALITCDDPKVARLLRSYADASRSVAFTAGAIRVSISQNYPASPKTVTVSVPIVRDDLDLARSQVPAGLHVQAWKR